MNCCFKGTFIVTSPFGERVLNGTKEFHPGIDIKALKDTNVYAPCDGTVLVSQIVLDKSDKTWEWGFYVCILSADEKYHVYLCHLASGAVRPGQKVKKGDKLGVMGYTGHVLPAGVGGTHTHFEVRLATTNQSINPAEFIGIPNTCGTYEENKLENNLRILNKHGIIDTPDHWELVATGKKPLNLEYFNKLLSNMAEALEK